MKYFPNKFYGHPVLRSSEEIHDLEFQNDYNDCFFETEILEADINSTKEQLDIPVKWSCTEPNINKMIEDDLASVILQVNEPFSSYSEVFKIAENSAEISIPCAQISGDLECSFFIVSEEKQKISSQLIEEDFQEKSFTIEQGEVIGYSQPHTIKLPKSSSNANLKDIVSWTFDEKIPLGCYDLDYNKVDETIGLIVNKDFYDELLKVVENKQFQSIVLSSFFIPIFTELITTLKDDEENQKEEWWKQILRQKIDDTNWELEDTPSSILAQAIFEFPLSSLAGEGFKHG